MSHIEAWKLIAGGLRPYQLILEDDVIGVHDYEMDIKKLICDLNCIDPFWDLSYVGRDALAPDLEYLSDSITKPAYSHGSFGYAVSRRGARRLLAYNLEKSIIPVDEFLPATFVKHPRTDVAERFPPRLRAYALRGAAILHLNDDDSDTENSVYV